MSKPIEIEQATWCEGWCRTPLWLRLIGAPATSYGHERTHRLHWGELTLGARGFAFRFGCYETAHLNIAVGVAEVFIKLPFLDRPMQPKRFAESPSFGFSCDSTTLHLSWGQKTRVIWWPWTRHHIRTEKLGADGAWFVQGRFGDPEPEIWSDEFPYHYMLDSGDVQSVTATVQRRRSRYGALLGGSGRVSSWLRARLPQTVFESIDVEFSEEVGSRRGSWKGGCIGCGYNMKPGETPKDTLRRMQRERRFR